MRWRDRALESRFRLPSESPARVDEGAGRRAARSCGTTATAPSIHVRPLLTVSHRRKATMPPTGHRARGEGRREARGRVNRSEPVA